MNERYETERIGEVFSIEIATESDTISYQIKKTSEETFEVVGTDIIQSTNTLADSVGFTGEPDDLETFEINHSHGPSDEFDVLGIFHDFSYQSITVKDGVITGAKSIAEIKRLFTQLTPTAYTPADI